MNFFFLKTSGHSEHCESPQSTDWFGNQGVSNLQFVTGMCNPGQTSWYFCSEQRACLANEPNYSKGLCLSHSCGTTRSKSPSADSCNCVCSKAHFGRTCEVQISRSSTLPIGCIFPTSGMFPCPQVTCWTYGGCVSSSSPQGRLQPQSQRLRFKPLLSSFVCYTMLSLPPIRRLLFSL